MKKLISIILICLVIISQTGCGMNSAAPAASSDTSYGEDWLLNTFCYIKTLEPNQEDNIAAAFKLARDYENKLSRTIESSEIATGKYSEETQSLVDKALEYEEKSGGSFCIHLGAVSALWDFSGEPRVPSAEEIKIGLEKQTVDLGAIAKGYITDKVAEYLKEQGVKSAIISLGGNIYCLGQKENKDPWQVGVEKPFSDNGKALETREQVGTIKVGSDMSVVTSGTYERCFTGEDGNFYHHILDPKTGYPVDTDIVSASIIGPSSCDCDALATAALALGSKDAPAFIESFGYEYVLILNDGSLIVSPGANFN